MANQYLSLNGSGYASITDALQAGLDMGLSDFMIEVRIKTTNTAGTSYFVWKHENLVGGYYIRIQATTGKLKGNLYDGTDAGVVSTASVTDGRWHYVVFVVDRSSATGLKLFLDGSEMAYDSQTNPTGIGSLDNASGFAFGSQSATSVLNPFIGQADELRVWNFGYGGLPTDYADYIAWRAAGRNVFLDISNYSSGSWNLYADAVRTELHDGEGAVTGMVVGKKYEYVTATPHTLDYQGGTLEDDGVFTATHTTGTIAGGDADDHVWRVGLVARYKFEGDYTDETINSNDLTAGGSGNTFVEYAVQPFALRKRGRYIPTLGGYN